MVQQQVTRESEIEKFITHRSWRKYTACLQGLYREIKAECRESQRTGRTCGTFPYQDPWVECVGVPRLGPDLSTQTKRTENLGEPPGVLPKG